MWVEPLKLWPDQHHSMIYHDSLQSMEHNVDKCCVALVAVHEAAESQFHSGDSGGHAAAEAWRQR